MQQIKFLAILLVLVHTGWGNPVVSIHYIVDADTNSNCPPGYSQPANTNWTMCYLVNTNYKTKYQAAQECAKLSNGTLASVPNAFVNSYLYTLASGARATSIWLGVEVIKNFNNTVYYNDDGTPFVYNNFNQGQPNLAEECVYLSAIGRDSQYWSTFDCNQGFAFACEAPVQQKNVSLPARCPQGYAFFNGTCYQFVDISPTQVPGSKALSLCAETPGGTLATIGSDQLNQFVMSLQVAKNTYTAFGLVCSTVAFDGDRSSCYWMDGTTYGSYNAFRDTDSPSEYYGGGCCDFNNGKWADCRPCDEERYDSYICEAPVQRF